MPTTREQKKARTSRGLEIMSDIENLDVMLGGNHFDREECEDSILARRPKSASCNASVNEENSHLNSRENRSGNSANLGQNSPGVSSCVEFNRLSGELNLGISREMDEMMNSVSVQIQRAISDAISNQVLPHIQNALMAGSGDVTQKRCNVPAERPEYNAEDYRHEKIRSHTRSEFSRNRPRDEFTDQAYDTKFHGNSMVPSYFSENSKCSKKVPKVVKILL